MPLPTDRITNASSSRISGCAFAPQCSQTPTRWCCSTRRWVLLLEINHNIASVLYILRPIAEPTAGSRRRRRKVPISSKICEIFSQSAESHRKVSTWLKENTDLPFRQMVKWFFLLSLLWLFCIGLTLRTSNLCFLSLSWLLLRMPH